MYVLHHYDFSPFSEKVRLAFGIKGLHWRSVEVPLANPKPDLVPLTGGYRRTPVLQIGADVFCDTALILREIDRRDPAPTLYPGHQLGLCDALAEWWETNTFLPAAQVATSIMGGSIPADFIAERKILMDRDFSQPASIAARPLNLQRVAAHLAWLVSILGDKDFLLGDTVSAADLAGYHTLWFLRGNGGAEAEAMLPLAPLLPWMERIAAFGHGTREAMTPQEALDLARASEPDPVHIDADPTGLRPGQPIAVRMDDMHDAPIRGTLASADASELVLRHEAPSVGTVHIHFPRAGYEVTADGR